MGCDYERCRHNVAGHCGRCERECKETAAKKKLECPDCRCVSNIDHSCSRSIAQAAKARRRIR